MDPLGIAIQHALLGLKTLNVLYQTVFYATVHTDLGSI